jgi:hypothetical protein
MRLDIRLIVPAPVGAGVLVDRDGRLPRAAVEGDEDEAAIIGVSAFLRDVWGFGRPVLETHPRWADIPEGDPIPTLVLTEPAAPDWRPPSGLAFGPIPESLGDLPPVLVPRATELLAELWTGAPPPELRPRWARRGWHDRAAAWMTDVLAESGRPLAAPPRPFYLRGISALLRGTTAEGDVFLKAVFPPFHAEPAISALLADRFPSVVPRVVATERDEGWLLVDDVAAPLIGEMSVAHKIAGLAIGARALVRLQRELGGDVDAFVAAGAPRRPLDRLAEAFDEAIRPGGVAIDEAITEDRRVRAVDAVRAAVERCAGLGFPTTLVHGDFHPGNAALVGDDAVIIDWSDAAIGSPIIDLITWLAWSRDNPTEQAAAIDGWIAAWAGPTDPAAVRERVDDLLLVGGAYQVVSYGGILAGLEPATRYTMADAALHYLERLEEAIARSAAADRRLD